MVEGGTGADCEMTLLLMWGEGERKAVVQESVSQTSLLHRLMQPCRSNLCC